MPSITCLNLWLALKWSGCWTRWSLEIPSNWAVLFYSYYKTKTLLTFKNPKIHVCCSPGREKQFNQKVKSSIMSKEIMQRTFASISALRNHRKDFLQFEPFSPPFPARLPNTRLSPVPPHSRFFPTPSYRVTAGSPFHSSHTSSTDPGGHNEQGTAVALNVNSEWGTMTSTTDKKTTTLPSQTMAAASRSLQQRIPTCHPNHAPSCPQEESCTWGRSHFTWQTTEQFLMENTSCPTGRNRRNKAGSSVSKRSPASSSRPSPLQLQWGLGERSSGESWQLRPSHHRHQARPAAACPAASHWYSTAKVAFEIPQKKSTNDKLSMDRHS